MNGCEWWNDSDRGKPEHLGKNTWSSATFSSKNLTRTGLGPNSSLRSEKQTTNRMSHGMALILMLNSNSSTVHRKTRNAKFYEKPPSGYQVVHAKKRTEGAKASRRYEAGMASIDVMSMRNFVAIDRLAQELNGGTHLMSCLCL